MCIIDQWTSSFTILVDFSFSLCDSVNVQTWLKLLRILPYWVRFAQSFRRYHDTPKIHHLYNAGKYFFAIAVVGVSVVYDYNKPKKLDFT